MLYLWYHQITKINNIVKKALGKAGALLGMAMLAYGQDMELSPNGGRYIGDPKPGGGRSKKWKSRNRMRKASIRANRNK